MGQDKQDYKLCKFCDRLMLKKDYSTTSWYKIIFCDKVCKRKYHQQLESEYNIKETDIKNRTTNRGIVCNKCGNIDILRPSEQKIKCSICCEMNWTTVILKINKILKKREMK